MRKTALVIVALSLVSAAYAELQNVQVGGELRIRGRWWSDHAENNINYVEQHTYIDVEADFTDNVSAYMALSSYDRWGEDFRSDYITGLDRRADTTNDVEFLQAYIQASKLYDKPVSLRVGRQELTYGKSWLAGSRVSPTLWITYDAIRVMYATDTLSIDGWWSKLAETSPVQEDGDDDYYGIYATYTASDALKVSAYWLYVRGAALTDMNNNGIPDRFGVSEMHTPGLRLFGGTGGFDYDLEAAYQFGEAKHAGGFLGFGDDGDYDAFAVDGELGYTFDATCSPRVFLGGAFFEGADDEDMAFNRVFSGIWYSSILDIIDGASAMTNFWQVRGGLSANATDAISVGLSAAYFGVDEEARGADDGIGTTTHLWVKYNYSEDLWIRIGWEHLFAEDGLTDGNLIYHSGLSTPRLTGDDADYIYFDTQVKF